MSTAKRSDKKYLTVRVPVWLESLDKLAEKYNLKPDRLRILLHQFFLVSCRNMAGKTRYNSSFFPVYSGILREVCTKSYSLYIDVLLAEGIITRKTNSVGGKCYVAGGHAQLYKWNIPEGMGTKLKVRSEKITDPTTIKSVLRAKEIFAKKDFNFPCTEEELTVFKKMKAYISLTDVDESSQANYYNSLDWFEVDDFGRRLHTKFTSMNKKYRKYLRFKGFESDKLVTLDFKNSQPYFLSILSTPGLIESIIPEFGPIAKYAVEYGKSEDWRQFQQLAIEGGLYEHFESGTVTGEKRKKIKQLMYAAVLFCKKRTFKDKKIFQNQFKKLFPSMFAFTELIRGCDANTLPELSDIIHYRSRKKNKLTTDSSRLMPCLLQRIESAFVFKLIAPELIRPDIPFITIHDSFMIRENDKQRVTQIIKDCFIRQGVTPPTISVE